MNIFEGAIRMEEEARKCYEELAAAATVPELKRLFTLLAAAEQEHRDTLVRLRENIKPSESRFTTLDVAAGVFRPLLSKRELMAELAGDPDAYRHVVAGEEKGIGLYTELASLAKDEGTRQVILMIAEEERKHLSIIENIYAFVESPKSYLASGEFSNLAEY